MAKSKKDQIKKANQGSGPSLDMTATKVQVLRNCSCSVEPYAFDFYENQTKTVPKYLADFLMSRGFAKLFEDSRWTLTNIGPSEYLRRYPSGPNADLARSVLGVEAIRVQDNQSKTVGGTESL